MNTIIISIKQLLRFTILLCFTLIACNKEPDKSQSEKWKREIMETENKFSNMASEVGIHNAFIVYAAEDAVLMRNDDLVMSKKYIDLFYKNKNSKGLAWTPDFVDVAASGDLGYTYGHYTFSHTDSTGKLIVNKGIFHTVWKRQSDGNWRFVWD